jgi:signal transduction histidine kinase
MKDGNEGGEGQKKTTLINSVDLESIRYATEGLVKKGYEVRSALNAFHTMIHHGEIPAEMVQTVALADLLNKAIDHLPAKSRDLVELELPDPNVKVSLPVAFFPNLVMNLVGNAVDHGKASFVRIWFNPEERTLFFRDNGKGISKEDLFAIFDFGYKESSSKGSGVGLAFVKMVVEAAGGAIECQSRQGEGSYTEFKIYLPY